MKLKCSEFVIPKENPFKYDVFDRKENAEPLTNILLSIDEPFVISIDSPWGTGKSTFVKMWRQSLENNGIPSIYYNAWENDFSEDPLVSLISEVDKGIYELKEKFNISDSAIEKFDQAKKIGITLIKKGIPLALKLATYGVVNINNVTEDSIASFVENFATEELRNYETSKNNLALFRKKLTEFVIELKKVEACENKPLVIFIDELDRCRPNFAINVLEKAKHFFNINGIVFVLSIDKEQIKNSISSIYGLKMKSSGYLNRFIDLSYNLQQPNNETFVNFLFEQYKLTTFFKDRTHPDFNYDQQHIEFIFSQTSSIFSLSLRDQIQCFTQLSIGLRMTTHNNNIFPIPFSFLIILKFANSELYYSFINHGIKGKALIEYLKKINEKSFLFSENYGFGLMAYLLWLSKDNSEIEHLKVITNDTSSTEKEKLKAKIIIRIVESLYKFDAGFVLKTIVKRIEILEKFSL